eukprot:c11905_g1_i1 orf=182-1174(+)
MRGPSGFNEERTRVNIALKTTEGDVGCTVMMGSNGNKEMVHTKLPAAAGIDVGCTVMMGSNGNKEMVHTKLPAAAGIVVGAAGAHVRSPTTIRLPEAEGLVAVRGQVMTDEQMETLRRQISVYATICQQLVEMHKATVAQQHAISGSKYQSSPLDSALHSMGQKFTSRQRWTPSQTQLQILEKLFQQGNGAPSKQRIKEISVELSQYGQISETNVYNWFQNRRARTKRKQQGGSNNGESEFDTDVDSQEEKRVCVDRDLSSDGFGAAQNQSNLQTWEYAEPDLHYDAPKGLQSSQRLAAVGDFAIAPSKADADDSVPATGLHMSGHRPTN